MGNTVKKAFTATIPVLAGYITIGFAFGVLFCTSGMPAGLAMLNSLVVFAGSMQFVSVGILTSGVGALQVVLMTLAVNLRHIAYGIPLLDTFNKMGLKKWYMVFTLTDETYALLVQGNVPSDVNEEQYFFAIAALNHIYWLFGTALGAVAGGALPFNTAGIEFSMTALFICIVAEQWFSSTNKMPAIIGMGVSVGCLVLFGAKNMLIPALFIILAVLILCRQAIEKAFQAESIEEVSTDE